MYCQKCGTQNDPNAWKCAKCGESLQGTGAQVPTQNVPNYLVQSILVTLLCCLPFGIAAIVYAAQVNGKAQAGDIAGAMESSRKAKMFCWIAFGLGLAGMVVYAIVMALGLAAGAAR